MEGLLLTTYVIRLIHWKIIKNPEELVSYFVSDPNYSTILTNDQIQDVNETLNILLETISLNS